MHIVLIGDHAHINGGQAKVMIESALGLRGAGHRVTLFAAVDPADARLAEAGVETVLTHQPDILLAKSQARFAVQTMWNRPAARMLAALLAGCDPCETVVHVHAWAKALSPSIGPAIQASGLACVYTMHEFFLVCPNGGFYDYRRAQVCTRVPLSVSCIACNCDGRSYPRKVLRMARQMLVNEISGLKEIADVITISQLQHEVTKPFMPAGTRWHHVPNPVAIDDPGPKGDAPLGGFLYAGRLSAEKGIAHFCEAARLAGVTAAIAGEGPLEAELRARYPEARFLGWKSPAALRALMREARALVFPSVWYEGQPLTVLESLALGTPVIVSDICAGREAVRDGVTGLWFRSADAADLAAKMTLMKADACARTMADAAHAAYWAEPLTLHRHVAALETIYAGLLAARRTAVSSAQRARAASRPHTAPSIR